MRKLRLRKTKGLAQEQEAGEGQTAQERQGHALTRAAEAPPPRAPKTMVGGGAGARP